MLKEQQQRGDILCTHTHTPHIGRNSLSSEYNEYTTREWDPVAYFLACCLCSLSVGAWNAHWSDVRHVRLATPNNTPKLQYIDRPFFHSLTRSLACPFVRVTARSFPSLFAVRYDNACAVVQLLLLLLMLLYAAFAAAASSACAGSCFDFSANTLTRFIQLTLMWCPQRWNTYSWCFVTAPIRNQKCSPDFWFNQSCLLHVLRVSPFIQFSLRWADFFSRFSHIMSVFYARSSGTWNLGYQLIHFFPSFFIQFSTEN